MGIWRVRVFLATAAVAVAYCAVAYDSTAGTVAYVVTYAALCGTAWSGVRRQAPGQRGPWVLIAAAITLWFTGDLIELAQYHLSTVPVVGPGDLCWLGGYPLLAAGLLQMARRRAPGRLRGAALDALTMTVAAAASSWQFLIAPVLGQGYGVLETVVAALYPVADVAVLAGVLFLAFSPGRSTAPTRMLLGAVSLYLAVDLGYHLLPYVLDETSVNRLQVVIMLGNALLVAAALHPARAELTRPGHQVTELRPARVLFLGLALMTTPTLTLLRSGFGRDEILALAAMGLCAVFVLSRFTIAVREQERAQHQLAFQARHDPLTGLANRATLGEKLRRAPAAPDAPVAVLYLDLDGFKQVNDQHGHEAGDAVLLAVAERLSAAVRESDLVARLDGDEFVLLCPGLPAEDAIGLAERVLTDIARPIPFRSRLLSVGASVGISAHTEPAGADPATVLRAADLAMYEAKRQGRGRWTLAGA